MKENQTIFEECSGELKALLEDVLTQIQELREEFTSTLDDIEDMITSMHAGSLGLCPKNPQGISPLTRLGGGGRAPPNRQRPQRKHPLRK